MSDGNLPSHQEDNPERPQIAEDELAAAQPSYLYNFDDTEFPLSQEDDDVDLPMMFLDYMDDGSISLANNTTLKPSPSNSNLSAWAPAPAQDVVVKTNQSPVPTPSDAVLDQQSQLSLPPLPQTLPTPLPSQQSQSPSDAVQQIASQQHLQPQTQPQTQQHETDPSASSITPSSAPPVAANQQVASNPQNPQGDATIATASAQFSNYANIGDFSQTGFLSELTERINTTGSKPNGTDASNSIPLLLQQQQQQQNTQQLQAALAPQTNANYQQVLSNTMPWSLPQLPVQNQADTSNNNTQQPQGQQQQQQSQQQALPQSQQLMNPVAILPKDDSSGQGAGAASNAPTSTPIQQVPMGQANQFFLSQQNALLNPQQFAVVNNLQQFQQQNQTLQQQQNFQYLQQLQQHGTAFPQINAHDVFPQIASNMSILPGQNVTNLAHYQLRQNAVNAQQQQNQESGNQSKQSAPAQQGVQESTNGNQTDQASSSTTSSTAVQQQQAGQQRILPLTPAQQMALSGNNTSSGSLQNSGNLQPSISGLSHTQYSNDRKRDMDHVNHSTDLMTTTPLAANVVSASDTDGDVPASKKSRQSTSHTKSGGDKKTKTEKVDQQNKLIPPVIPRNFQSLSSATAGTVVSNLASATTGSNSATTASGKKVQASSTASGTITSTSLDGNPEMTEDDKALANRLRNREHARNTRARKKAYLESLKSTLDDLCKERDNLKNERAGAATRLLEIQTTRTDVLMSFFALRSSNELRRNYWASVLDETVTCNMPVTPYRSFPASEVQVAECQRTIMGIDGMMADAASLHVLLNSLVDRSRFPSGVVEFRYTLIAEEAVVSGNQMMARWNMSTLNASKLGAKKEVHKMGMLCAKFNGAHKIVGFDIMFDVMAFMLQLKQSANSFSVVPNTVQTCQGPFGGRPMVMTLADRPYTIVQVNKQWEEMTGWKAEEVVGKASCSILQGDKTERVELDKMMTSVRYKKAAYAVLTNYMRNKDRIFRNFLTMYPLSTNSKITHYAAFTLHFEWIDMKQKGVGVNSAVAGTATVNHPIESNHRLQNVGCINGGSVTNSIAPQQQQQEQAPINTHQGSIKSEKNSS